jgi:hypothetical protein
MGFAWGHTTYAKWQGMIFNFEDKWDLDYFLAHAEGAERISAVDAWKDETYNSKDFIQVFSSRCLGADKCRAERIKRWKDEQRQKRIG